MYPAHTHPNQGSNHNPYMWPDYWKSNLQPLGAQDDVPGNWATAARAVMWFSVSRYVSTFIIYLQTEERQKLKSTGKMGDAVYHIKHTIM